MLSSSLGQHSQHILFNKEQHHISDDHESLQLRLGIPPKPDALGGTAAAAEERSATYQIPIGAMQRYIFGSFLLFRNNN